MYKSIQNNSNFTLQQDHCSPPDDWLSHHSEKPEVISFKVILCPGPAVVKWTPHWGQDSWVPAQTHFFYCSTQHNVSCLFGRNAFFFDSICLFHLQNIVIYQGQKHLSTTANLPCVHACMRLNCFGNFFVPQFLDHGSQTLVRAEITWTQFWQLVQKINPSLTLALFFCLPPSSYPPSPSSLSHLLIFLLPSQPPPSFLGLLHPFLLSSPHFLRYPTPPPFPLTVIDSAQCCYFIQRAL